jgi:CBS domain-containing protein
VVDGNHHSVGLLTLRTLLGAIGHAGPQRKQKSRYLPVPGFPKQPLLVKHIMRSLDRGAVDVHDGIDSVIRAISHNNANYVPVLDGGALVGLVRAIDLFWFIEELL